eukprot:3827049-Pleurochrysis_carterae.AAC.1
MRFAAKTQKTCKASQIEMPSHMRARVGSMRVRRRASNMSQACVRAGSCALALPALRSHN